MKKTLPLFLALFFFGLHATYAQIYVKHDAAGANDGSSWENAFTDLSEAITASSLNDEIWVAAGTYKPGGSAPSTSSFFDFPHDLSLYGGFAGTETSLSERDWTANETILSGDHNDDDVDGNFADNRTDNSNHVMWLTNVITAASNINGFTIRNGNTEPSTGSGDNRRGGGILSYGAPTVKNCLFTQNYGYFGGGLYPRGAGAIGIIIDSCVFDSNIGDSSGGGIYNTTGGASIISNCDFLNNHSWLSRGGALYNSASPSIITDCTFTGNTAEASSGGALQIRNTSDDASVVTVSDCIFMENQATWGGAVGVYDRNSIADITGCTFTANTSVNVGGGLSNAFGATTNITNSYFEANESGSGGALYSQNDSAFVNITNSEFVLNVAEVGGAINVGGDNDPSSTTPLPLLTIIDSRITTNLAETQAGGINISNANLNMTSCLIASNLITGAGVGIGGGISFNTSDSISTSFSIMNSTIVDNFAGLGAGISNWHQGVEVGTTDLQIQNTILMNPFGNNYEIELGTPTVTSNGGNLSSDMTMEDYLIGTNDLNSTDPLFVDFDEQDFHIIGTSPCINTGIAAGAPLTDLDGLPRVGEVDMGSFENQNPVGIRELDRLFGHLDVYPNPVETDLNFTFDSEWIGKLEAQIVDLEGRMISSVSLNKLDQTISHSTSVEHLPQGQYNLVITNGLQVKTHPFVVL